MDLIANHPTITESHAVVERHIKKITLAIALLTSLPALAQSPHFTPGNLVVAVEGCGNHGGTCTPVPNGKGAGGLYGDNQAAPLTLFQYTPVGTTSATFVNSLVLPQTGSAANLPVSGEYGSSSEGTLQLAGTGQYLTIMGYGINAATFDATPAAYGAAPSNALAQSGSLTGQSYTPVARVVALIDANGNVNSSTALYNVFNTNNPRSVYSADGMTAAYVSGQGSGSDATGGVFLTPLGGVNTAPTPITGLDTSSNTLSQDTRDVQIYNNTVTYAENPTAHLKVEFGFDVLQVSRGNYAPQSYRDFIGFQISKELLDRAFHDTYGLQLKDVFTDVDLAIGAYRRAVSAVIPEMTRVAWSLNRKDLAQAAPRVDRAQFVYNLSRASYEKSWGRTYQKPGIGARVLAFFIRILPKIGPVKAEAFKPPTPQTAKWFEDSFDQALADYRVLLAEVETGKLHIANMNFDTGEPALPARYTLADEAYAKLTVKLAERDAATVNPQMRAAILAYYRNLDLPFATKHNAKEWQKTVAAIGKLKARSMDESR
jgi:hypothetical protein